MAQDRIQQMLQQGVEAAKAGQKPQAFQILQQVVRLDPRNETAWLWLSSVARNPRERAFCLRQLYEINPKNELALKGLRAMGIDPTAEQQQPTVQSDIPIVSQEKLSAIQPTIDDFLRSYKPEPYTPLEIVWVHKDGRRYGEGAARRLKSTVYLTAGLVALVLLIGVLVGGFYVIGVLQPEEEEAAGRASLTPSNTPRFTLTPTEVLNTPLPDGSPTPWPVVADDLTPGPVPVGPGVLSNLPRATNVYPQILGNSVTIRDRSTAVAYYAQGEYEQLSTLSADIRAADVGLCWQESYYYDAMGLANQGGRSNLTRAEEILEEALDSDASGAENTCISNDAALINAGRCFVNYQQAILDPDRVNSSELSRARSLCEQAHTSDPALVQAADTLAAIYLLDGQPDRAFTVLAETREADEQNRGNIILLLRLADVELARDPINFAEAFDYIAQALYVDPLSEDALRKRVEAYLMWAAQDGLSNNERVLRYGVASIYAEEHYLYHYPGVPRGYVLLAAAKAGEGNLDKALTPLTIAINAIEAREDPDEALLQQAYALRVDIYRQQHNWQAAFDDLERLLELDSGNLTWLEQQKDVAYAMDRYDVVSTNLERLLASRSDDVTLQLEEAALLSRICQYEGNVSCDYREVAREISDEFIDALPPEDEGGTEIRAEARSYQIEANFDIILNDDSLSDNERSSQLEDLLSQLLDVLSVRETAADYYLLGRLYEALDEPEQAVAAYDMVLYWDQFYDYPFGDNVEDARDEAVDNLDT